MNDSTSSLINNYADKINDIHRFGVGVNTEDQEESNNLVDICRVCMVNDAEMINLWSPPTEKFDEEFDHIKDVLASFTSIQIDENERLPQVICEKCEANIYFIYHFKRKCENSDEILRNAIKYKVEHVEETIIEICQPEESINEKPIDINNSVIPIAYPCSQCSEVFEQRVQLSKHIKTIHKRYKCDDCGGHFAQPQILRRHRKIHMGIKNKPCPMCAKCFLRADDLKRHIRIHTGERPFRCDQCPKSFKQSSELIQHKFTHSNVKQFVCKLCNKSLATRNGYYIHMKVHNDQKNHQCHLCDKKFVTISERTSHIQYIHVKEKRFECSMPDCTKRFVTKISLNKHHKIHAKKMKIFDMAVEPQCPIITKHLNLYEIITGERDVLIKEFECTICDKKFSCNSTLTEHMMIHTPLICEICGAPFSCYETFVCHRLVHNVKNKDDDAV